MIKIYLSRILGEKRITRNQLAKNTGIRPNTLGQLYHERIKRLDLDILDKLCKELNISVGELIEYIPDKQNLE